jgi:hypothetical protein
MERIMRLVKASGSVSSAIDKPKPIKAAAHKLVV